MQDLLVIPGCGRIKEEEMHLRECRELSAGALVDVRSIVSHLERKLFSFLLTQMRETCQKSYLSNNKPLKDA